MNSSARHASNLAHAFDLVFFEQWLRFYFIEERGEALYLNVPDAARKRCREEYPALSCLLETLDGQEIDHQATLAALGDAMLHGEFPLNSEDWAEVLCGVDFRVTMQLISYWVQDEEDSLDAEVLSFSVWKERFMVWRDAPAMRDYAARLRGRLNDEQEPDAPDRVQ